jgi:hypothetical protein
MGRRLRPLPVGRPKNPKGGRPQEVAAEQLALEIVV